MPRAHPAAVVALSETGPGSRTGNSMWPRYTRQPVQEPVGDLPFRSLWPEPLSPLADLETRPPRSGRGIEFASAKSPALLVLSVGGVLSSGPVFRTFGG